MFFEGLLEKKRIFIFMAMWACLLGISPRISFCMPVNSLPSSAQVSQQKIDDLGKLNSFLELEPVKKKLLRMGLGKNEINQRLAKLDDATLHRLAQRAGKITAGGDSTGIVIILILLTLIFVAILYFTDRVVKIEPRRPVNQ